MTRIAWRVVACMLVFAATPAAAQDQDAEAPQDTEAPQEAQEADTAQEAELEEDDEVMVTGDVVVSAQAEEVFEAGGSVHALGEEDLRELAYDDPMAALTRVPGVYVRSEDGFGLRPNIGMRGASSERSRKITLLEDGVLMAPAPYSSPAAYYFPMMARMVGVEVYAGPAAIQYGPNTIGGAIDLTSRQIPTERRGHLALAVGNPWLGRAHGHYGDSNEWGGFLVEALHLRSNGFHELDRPEGVSGDTGFQRTEVLVRGDLHGTIGSSIYHRLELTAGLGLEGSNETYLGTTDADFRANPNRRYAATQLDRMDWLRTRLQLRYELESESVSLRAVAYRHDLERTWYRLDHFCDALMNAPDGERDTCNAAVGFDRILREPQVYASQLARLTGAVEPMLGDAPLLMARNHRVFAVNGLQADATISLGEGVLTHRVRVGARVHFDEVRRVHTGDTYQLERMRMELQTPGLELERNHDQALALAGYASWAMTWRRLTVSPGVRTELVWTKSLDEFTGVEVNGKQLALLPGIGLRFDVLPKLAAFAGAHLGYSPVTPGSGPEVLPEMAWNYEIGARWGLVTDDTHAQLTYFVSDYDNLSSTCTLASGCRPELIDRQLNAGAVLITGLEAEAAHTFKVGEVALPIAATYTWTWSRFLTAFESPNPQLGSVQIGYRLPYVAEHQLGLRAGLSWRRLEVNVGAQYISPMRDVAGLGEIPEDERTDASFVVDARASLEVIRNLRIVVRGENLTGAQPLLTRRAWGARGSRPTLVQVGFEVDFR